LRELRRDKVLVQRIGEKVVEEFIIIKELEVGEFQNYITDWEFQTYSRL
jgi:glutamine synthetase